MLGPDSAGKSTTVKILANEIVANKGEVFIAGENIHGSQVPPIGYCAEGNVLFENLTIMNHFTLYSAIKGLPFNVREDSIKIIMARLGLAENKDTVISKLSHSSKRKLSVGLALLGNPPVLFLDEPSSGVDAQAREEIRTTIRYFTEKWKQSAVVLATHSLEEAEASATRLAIMINGTIRSIGAPQVIKNKYGVGYYIEVTFDASTPEQAKQFLDSVGLNMDIDQPMSFIDLKKMLIETNMNAFEGKIRSDGECSDLWYIMTTQLQTPLSVIINHILHDQWKDQMLYSIARECGETKVETLGAGHYKYKVCVNNVSVGGMFGVVEDLVFIMAYLL